MSLAKVVFFDIDVPERVEDIQNKVIKFGQFEVNYKNVKSQWQLECNLRSRNGDLDYVVFGVRCSVEAGISAEFSSSCGLVPQVPHLGRNVSNINSNFNTHPLLISHFNESAHLKQWEHTFKLDTFLRFRTQFFPDGKLRCRIQIFAHDLEASVTADQIADMGDLQMFDHMIQAPANVTLKTHDGYEIKVNKEMLSMASDVFTTMFITDMTESLDNVVHIKEFNGEVIHELMSFIYCKKVKKDIAGIHYKLFKAAHAYIIKDLFNVCLESIVNNLKFGNVLFTALFADLYEQQQLFAICCERIYLMWHRITLEEMWTELDAELKTKIINEIMKRSVNSLVDDKSVEVKEEQPFTYLAVAGSRRY